MVTVVLENKILAIFPIKWLKILIFVPIYIIIKKKKKKKRSQSLVTKLVATTLLSIFLLEMNFTNPLLDYNFFLYPPCLQNF